MLIMRFRDAILASGNIGHEAALTLKYWVWFYRIEQVLFSSTVKR